MRLFIVAEWLIVAAAFVAAMVLETPVAEATDDVQRFVWADGLGIFAVAAWLVGSIGAFRLWRPARTIYACAVAVLVAASALTEPEPSLGSALLETLDQFGTLASGIVLGLLFFSEARHRFGSADARTPSSP